MTNEHVHWGLHMRHVSVFGLREGQAKAGVFFRLFSNLFSFSSVYFFSPRRFEGRECYASGISNKEVPELFLEMK